MDAYWVIDVLNDLRAFARENGYARLAEDLDDATITATADIALRRARSEQGMGTNADGLGGHSFSVGISEIPR